MIIMSETFTDGMILKASEPTKPSDINDLSKKMIGIDPKNNTNQMTSQLTGIPAGFNQNKPVNTNTYV